MRSDEWAYDASNSRLLLAASHLPVAGIGGSFLLVAGAFGAAVVGGAFRPGAGPLLLAALLVVVGGPFSLAYLWPMLTDRDQRPSVAEFSGAGGFPFTVRSVLLAAVLGAVGIVGLLAVDAPFDAVYWIVVGLIFSPILVAAVTTRGELEGDDVAINGTAVPLARVSGVRTLRVGSVVVLWISYERRSGAFLPRVVAVPRRHADRVRTTLESGIARPSDVDPPDGVVRAVLVVSGVSVLGVAALAYVSIDEGPLGRNVGVAFGAIGLSLCALGWRGL